MPIQLRQRLNCHYCGGRSKVTKKPGRKFKCEYCLADNFFDEACSLTLFLKHPYADSTAQNGEIADVPLDEAAPAQRYAEPVATDPLTDDFSSQDSIFCSTCLKNQSLYTYNLSQFLPDPDHPDYDKLEAELPEFKKALEKRYPQCCAECEPKVRAQLHQATYNARSDHLRRVLDKSRQRRIASRWGWRSLVVSAAGLGYLTSLTMQLLWHLYASQITETSFVPDFRPAQCLERQVFLSQCLDLLEPLVPVSLTIGLLSIWWNPRWQHKLSNNEVRLLDLDKYYTVQWVLLGMRLSAWIIMSHVPLELRVKAMVHACYAVAITVVAGWSLLAIVKVRIGPAVNWHEDPAPLLLSDQFVPPKRPHQEETIQHQSQPFNVHSLAAPSAPGFQAWRPPTPPEEGTESMDWTPSQPTFTPELKQVRYKSTDPTPFHGTLPAFNAKGVQKNQTQTQRRSKQAIGLPPGFFDKSTKAAIPARQQNSASEAIAQPKFFGHAREAETGLESVFGAVFSLQDHSLEPALRAAQRPKRRPSKSFSPETDDAKTLDEHGIGSFSTIFSGIAFFSTAAMLAVWIFEAAVTPQTSELGYYIVLASTSIPLGHIAIDLCLDRSHGQVRRLLLYGLEASALVGVAMLQDQLGHLFRDLWDKLAIATVALLLPQELLQLNRTGTAPLYQVQRRTHLASIPEEQEHETEQPRITIPIETPPLRRQDSDESAGSKASSTSAESNPGWETPRVEDFRFDYPSFRESSPVRPVGREHAKGRQTPARNNMFGMDGLSLGSHGSLPHEKDTTLTNDLGRMNFDSGSRSRSRRAF